MHSDLQCIRHRHRIQCTKLAHFRTFKMTNATQLTTGFLVSFRVFYFYSQGERNLENVTHEEAVATLKSITDKVTLVVGKTNLGLNNTNSIGLTNSNSQSTSAVNSVGQNVVDFARSQSPAAAVNSSSRSHSPRNVAFVIFYMNPVFAFYYDEILLLCFRKQFNFISFQSKRSSVLNF